MVVDDVWEVLTFPNMERRPFLNEKKTNGW
jgi:hypothetical protein